MHEQIIAGINLLITVLATAAKYTATTIDDSLAKILQAVIDNPDVQHLIAVLVGDSDVIAVPKGADRMPAIYEALEKAKAADPSWFSRLETWVLGLNIDWPTFLSYAATIVRFILSYQGKR